MRAPHSILFAALGLLGACHSTPATRQFNSSEQGARALTLQLGALTSSTDEPGETRARSARIGIAQQFRDGFALVGELGASSFDEPNTKNDTVGVDASVLLRWEALRGQRWNAFFEYGLGLLGTEDDFPSGGTSFNGTRHAGAGLAFDLTHHLRLTLGVRQQHVSNGRGLVSDNPSWDGFGGYVGLSIDVTPSAARERPLRSIEAQDGWAWSLRSEARAGDLGDETGGGAQVALDTRLTDQLYLQARVSSDSIDGESLVEGGLALYLRGDHGLLGLALDRQELDVFEDNELSIFAERYANDLVTVAATLGYEGRNFRPDRVAGGLSLRLYPFESLLVESGIGFRDSIDDFDSGSIDLPLGLEYAPGFLRQAGVSLFVEDGLRDDGRMGGIRWNLASSRDKASALRDLHRASGPVRHRY